MSVQLVIAEKPSVARSIAAVIGAAEKQNGYWQGGGYLVSWCIGHLVSFAEAGQYDEKYCRMGSGMSNMGGGIFNVGKSKANLHMDYKSEYVLLHPYQYKYTFPHIHT